MAGVHVFDTGTSRYGVAISGIEAFESLDDYNRKSLVSASRAVNRTLDWTRTRSAEAIKDQVAFPASYLNPAEGRLVVKTYATTASPNPTGKIGARVDPTSLARFVKGNPKVGQHGVTVEVKPGKAVTIQRAFIMKLANANLGLAVRSKGAPERAYKPKSIGKDLWLLYGPSVSQVFDTVRSDVGPAAAEYLENEYNRQMELD